MKRISTLTTLALASALALAGCAGGEETTGSVDSASPTAAAGAQAGTAAAGSTDSTAPSGSAEAIAEEHNDADVMFAQMMIPHHQQAVEMSETLLAKDDVPAQVRAFAQQVVDAQGPEIDQLNAMLTAWGQEPMMESGGMDRGSMSHGTESSGMDGMMSEDDMRALDGAQGAEAARLYLEQMTTHHQGAIEMAQEEVDNGHNPQAVELAGKIVTDQQDELTEMEDLLRALPSPS